MLLNKIMFRNLLCQSKRTSWEVIIVAVLSPGRLHLRCKAWSNSANICGIWRSCSRPVLRFPPMLLYSKSVFKKRPTFCPKVRFTHPFQKRDPRQKDLQQVRFILRNTCRCNFTLLFVHCFQWRIAHFPNRPSISIALTYYLQIVCQKTAWKFKNLDRASATGFTFMTQHFWASGSQSKPLHSVLLWHISIQSFSVMAFGRK